MILTTDISIVSPALTVQVEALQHTGNIAAGHVNARGETIAERLEGIPARVNEVALHGVRHGAATAFTTADVCTGADLSALNNALPADEAGEIEDRMDNFVQAAEAIAAATVPTEIINNVFL